MKKIFLVTLSLGLAVVISGCSLVSSPAPVNQNANNAAAINQTKVIDQSATLTDKKSCEELGGQWGNIGDNPAVAPSCNLPTADAGKACTDNNQCESFCQAPSGSAIGAKVTGVCYGFKKASCMQEVKNGVAEATKCY